MPSSGAGAGPGAEAMAELTRQVVVSELKASVMGWRLDHDSKAARSSQQVGGGGGGGELRPVDPAVRGMRRSYAVICHLPSGLVGSRCNATIVMKLLGPKLRRARQEPCHT